MNAIGAEIEIGARRADAGTPDTADIAVSPRSGKNFAKAEESDTLRKPRAHGTTLAMPAPMRPLAWLVLALPWCPALVREAAACSVAEPYQEYSTQATGDVVRPVLSAATIEITRSKNPGPGHGGECGGMGQFRIRVDASDDQTSKEDLGFSLSVVEGSVPFYMPKTNVQGTSEGDLSSWFSDNGNAFAGTVEVKVVDRAGNQSDPIQVRAASEAVGCGCSVAGAPASTVGWLGSLAVTALCLRRIRRRGPNVDYSIT